MDSGETLNLPLTGHLPNKIFNHEEINMERCVQVGVVVDSEAGPPGFEVGLEEIINENSIKTAVHILEETTDSDGEVNGFSMVRARLIHEKLGISFPGTINADKAFADFCRNRQKKIDIIRKKIRCTG